MCGNIFRFAAAAGAVKEETERPGVGESESIKRDPADLDPFIRENTPFGLDNLLVQKMSFRWQLQLLGKKRTKGVFV